MNCVAPLSRFFSAFSLALNVWLPDPPTVSGATIGSPQSDAASATAYRLLQNNSIDSINKSWCALSPYHYIDTTTSSIAVIDLLEINDKKRISRLRLMTPAPLVNFSILYSIDIFTTITVRHMPHSIMKLLRPKYLFRNEFDGAYEACRMVLDVESPRHLRLVITDNGCMKVAQPVGASVKRGAGGRGRAGIRGGGAAGRSASAGIKPPHFANARASPDSKKSKTERSDNHRGSPLRCIG